MRIYTVTCNGMPAAVVRADNPSDAVDIAQALGGRDGLGCMALFFLAAQRDARRRRNGRANGSV